MRCWQTALRQINEYKEEDGRLPGEAPQSETERALAESLQLLELQCRERADLLEALKLSRQDDSSSAGEVSGSSAGRGWIGGGTIPAVTYTELSRPALPPRSSSGSTTGIGAVAAGRPSIPERLRSGEVETLARAASPGSPGKDARQRSPEHAATMAAGQPFGKWC